MSIEKAENKKDLGKANELASIILEMETDNLEEVLMFIKNNGDTETAEILVEASLMIKEKNFGVSNKIREVGNGMLMSMRLSERQIARYNEMIKKQR